MKTTSLLTAMTIVVLLCTGTCVYAQCHMGGNSHNHSGNSTITASSSEVSASSTVETVTYTCPMHPEVTSDKPGKCPKCGIEGITNLIHGFNSYVCGYSWRGGKETLCQTVAELMKNSERSVPSCNCDIMSLMAVGCKCGQMEREKNK